jgi:hypothetical protein
LRYRISLINSWVQFSSFHQGRESR